jgi:hypothetical protein
MPSARRVAAFVAPPPAQNDAVARACAREALIDAIVDLLIADFRRRPPRP